MDFFSVFNPWATVSSLLLRPCSGRVPLPHCQSETDLPRTGMAERPFRRVNVLMADKRFTFISPLSSSRTNKRKSFSITTILNGKTKPYNTTYSIRTTLSYCSAWIKVPAPSLREQYPDVKFYSQASPSLSSSPQRAAWATTRKMYAHLRKDAVDVYGYERGRLCFLPIPLNAEAHLTVSTIYYIYGNNSASSRNAMSCT